MHWCNTIESTSVTDDKEILVYSKNMGVKTLWSVIGGAGEPTDLRSLQGKCVAIDLAGWAVQGGQCSGMYRSGVTRVRLQWIILIRHKISLIYFDYVPAACIIFDLIILATLAKFILSLISLINPQHSTNFRFGWRCSRAETSRIDN